MDAAALLLTVGFRHVINEPNIEAAYERFTALTNAEVDQTAFRNAIAISLRDGLIHGPIRLPEGALQCHWHLELTPKGIAAVRALPQTAGDKPCLA
jgi:hypothetical protein